MDFAELVAEVTSLTSRPDLSAKIESAVRAATLKAHQSGFYYKDLREKTIALPEPSFIQALDFLPEVPRFRKIRYIRAWNMDNSGGAAGRVFQNIQVENIRDAYGYDKSDVYYMAGRILHVRSSAEIRYLLVGYYEHPSILADDFQSWIAEEFPFVIVYEATRAILTQIGFTAQAREYLQMLGEELRNLYIENVTEEAPT